MHFLTQDLVSISTLLRNIFRRIPYPRIHEQYRRPNLSWKPLDLSFAYGYVEQSVVSWPRIYQS